MAGGSFPVSITKPDTGGNATSVTVGLIDGPGWIASFAAQASWYGVVDVPKVLPSGTPTWEIDVYSPATSGNFQFGLWSVELVPNTTASGATRAQDGGDQTVTFATTAARLNRVTVALDYTPTAGQKIELEIRGLTASTVASAVRVRAKLIYA